MESKTISSPNISCGHCVHTIEMELGELKGVNTVKADQESKQVTVVWEQPATWADINRLLVEIGYPPAA